MVVEAIIEISRLIERITKTHHRLVYQPRNLQLHQQAVAPLHLGGEAEDAVSHG